MGGILPFFAALLIATAALGARGGPPPSWPGILLLVAAYYAGGRGLAGSLAAGVLRAGGAAETERAFRVYRRATSLYRHAAVAVHAVVLWPAGGGTAARAVAGSLGEVPGLVAALAPWLALVAAGIAAQHPAERLLGIQPLPLGRSLLQAGRIGSLLAAPVLLVLLLAGAGEAFGASDLPPFPALADLAARWDFVAAGLGLAALAGALALFPVIAMALLGARPLPPGPLRDRLEAYAARTGLRYRDLYVWRTGSGLLNAAVLGVGGRLRCVVFTDGLLERLDDEEVEAVFAHEAGHAIHGHIPLFFLFTVAFSLATFGLLRLLPPDLQARLETDADLSLAVAGGAALVYFGVLFGFVSRRLEQQADVHGLLTVGLPDGEDPARVLREPERHPFLRAAAAGQVAPADHPFVRGLEGIGRVMGGVREITGWRHFSLADRVRFLEAYVRDGAVRAAYARNLRLLLGLLAAVFLLFAGAAALDLPAQAAGPSPGPALGRAAAALGRGRPEEARRWIEDGLRGAAARDRALAPSAPFVPRGGDAAAAALLVLPREAEDPDLPAGARHRLLQCEAILRSVLRRPEEALAVADRALALLPPASEGEAAAGARAAHLLLEEDLLRRAGRPRAADAAREEARERALDARDPVLVEAARPRE